MPKLVITDGDGIRELALTGEVKAGRLADNAIQLKVSEASRHHCRFFEEKGSWFVEDLGSSNGTLVNGRKVSKFELQDGDVIGVGTATMKYLDVEVAAAPEASGWGDDDEITLENETFLMLGAPGRVGEVVKLAGERVSVGRTKKNLISLLDASVSGEHAELVKRGDAWFVRDLASSNGTFVDGEKVKEKALASGQVIRFGTIEARFCVGKEKDFSPPAAVDDAPTEAIEVGGAGASLDDAAFEMHANAAAAKGGGAGGIVAIVLLLAMGGGAAFLAMQKGQAEDGPEGAQPSGVRRSTNLVPEAWWSFEPPKGDEVPTGGWRKEDPSDRASVNESSSDARSGSGGLTISRGPDSGPPTFVVLDAGLETDFSVSAGSWYRISAAVKTDGPETQAGPCVSWYGAPAEGETEPRLLWRDLAVAPSASGWTEAGAFVMAVDGATKARVGCVAAGRGDASYDDVVFEPADAAQGSGVEHKNFKATLSTTGAVRLARFGRAVFEGAGVWTFPAGGEPLDPWMGVEPRAGGEPGRAPGRLRGKGEVSASLVKKDDRFVATWTFGDDAPEAQVALPIAGTPQDLNLTVFEGDRAVRRRAAFADVASSSVILGEAGDRARIAFTDGEGKPLAAKLSVVAKGGRPILKVDRGAARVVSAEIQLSFEAEQKAAQELLAKAGEALRAGKDGEALRLYDETLARFPFEEAVEREASQKRERTLADAQKRLRDLTSRVDDALFFRTARRDDVLSKDLTAEAARLAGTELESGLKALGERFEGERKKAAAERAEAEAAAAFRRAQDYQDNVNGRKESAAAFFESVARRYPDSEWGKRAAQIAGDIKSGGGK